ncbi:unnamed protein product [Macrosiphum euphorbiae]|uniref:RNA-directed DNA polymerase n=3 Tax=Macrosiphum euphorbiae TaxID=13131 RepID=A0AAV0XHP9_9HEMI|nr:unnamed protein product [Macrosiphum euphorbiae]
MTPAGKVQLAVTNNNESRSFWAYVIPNGGPPLIGRNDIVSLGIENIYSCNFNAETIDSILGKYKQLFEPGLGTFNAYTISLKLKPGASPKFCKHRAVPLALRDKVITEIERLVENNTLIPIDSCEWATPVVPILKGDGSVRLCGDYKITINPVLNGTEYPLPKIEHLYAKIAGAKYFSKIDLKDAYQQLLLDDDSQRFTTINTIKGLFKYTRVPFGLKSSAGEFQRAIESVTSKVEGVEVFIDDIIVSGSTVAEHNARLNKLLNWLNTAGLKVKKEKCNFLQKSIEYLGHKIDGEGLHTLSKHVNAIKGAPAPQNRSELKSFLGLVTYYAKFIKNAAQVLTPLYNLLRENVKWSWSRDASQAFNDIKRILSSKPVLDHYNPNIPIKLSVDASSFAIGAVLSQIYDNKAERPVAYASRVLSDTERRYPQIEKEGLAIIYGIQKFYDYLYARKFTLLTDHKPLYHIFGDKKGIPMYAANRLQRWAYVLSAFDFEIVFVKSEQNPADFLSRIKLDNYGISPPEQQCVNFIHDNCPFIINWHKIKTQTRVDSTLSRVIRAINTDNWPTDAHKDAHLKPYFSRKHEITTEQDCLMWGYRIIIPDKFRAALLRELHSVHSGMSSMKAIARSYFWWPKLDSDIEDIARRCENCIQIRPAPPRAVLSPWKWPEQPWTRLHVDFLGPYKNKNFLVVIDATSKWLEAFETNLCTASTVITKMEELFARFGVPKSITSDGAKCFTGSEFNRFCTNGGIKHLVGAPFHPETNGAAESGVKILKNFFKKNKTTSTSLMQKFLLLYRNTPHSTTQQSPAKLLLGHNTRTPFDALIPDTKDVVSDNQTAQIKRHGKRQHNIGTGDSVAVRDYRDNDRKWAMGTVKDNIGKNVFEVETEEGDVWKRHSDQTIKIPTKETASKGETDNTTVTELIDEPVKPNNNDSASKTGINVGSVSPRVVRIKKNPERYQSIDFRKE